jgi:hypothetical protein
MTIFRRPNKLVIISVEKKRKHYRNILYKQRKIIKKKEKRLYNGENSNDDNINTHSDFLIGKAVAMVISFGMIKSVRTINITSNLIDNSQFSVITQKLSRVDLIKS